MTTYGRMRDELVEDGRLRVAINLGNAALAARGAEGGGLEGITVALARRLAAALGCEPDFTVYEGAGKVVDAAGEDAWRIAFCAIDPERREHVAYSSPYVLIEAGALVRAGSPLRHVDELDRPGMRLLVARNSAYDLYLTSHAKAMDLVREADPGASFRAFKAGDPQADAVAGVVQSLRKAFGDDGAYRYLSGTITAIGQAMALPKRFEHLAPDLTRFVEEAKADGFVRRELDRAGKTSLTVAPAETG
ncbi:restriction endonuclease [Fulvimarina endophytica]|uniref:Restriction endonuclease n=1 Tax=Fulvimarina endophytica TaxID=2293836 RepID=A0A371WYM4_9HYPH|nr:transporter substrate-binding domain-containing protein [Fulvimarina endophytica]RFC62059.1 restriction endonuclease [Fulvimarina endophytica]